MYLFISSYILDIIFGDPEWMFHPVRIIGKVTEGLEGILIRGKRYAERLQGVILVILVVGISVFLADFLLRVSARINVTLGALVWIYLGYTTISVKDLRVKAITIFKALENNCIDKARYALKRIVGRDTDTLDETEIVKAAVESISESANDGIIAPLFYLLIGGPVLAIAYKAVNTLDSMIGHKDERHIHFGWFAARLDDITNFIPARICGFLICFAAFVLGKSFENSFRTMLRDGRKHPSPNSGISESAMAGSLGICLGGPSTYEGELEPKPCIGEDRVMIYPALINEALRISLVTSMLFVLIGVALKWAL